MLNINKLQIYYKKNLFDELIKFICFFQDIITMINY
jgi:hypothetical protein